jgi:hypothetical protein
MGEEERRVQKLDVAALPMHLAGTTAGATTHGATTQRARNAWREHGSRPEWRGQIHAVLIAFAAWIAAGIGFDGEERIYLQRRADGISAGERRTLIDNNNRQRAGRDTAFRRGYHDQDMAQRRGTDSPKYRFKAPILCAYAEAIEVLCS